MTGLLQVPGVVFGVLLILVGILESFFFRDQRFYRLFLINPDDMDAVRMWTFNLGFYNMTCRRSLRYSCSREAPLVRLLLRWEDGTVIPDDPRAMVRSTELARFRLAPNPGPMSLHGTNSYVIAAPGAAGTVVVDPGPLDEPHLQELARAGAVELILVTHRHADHTAAAARFAEMTGAPVRAKDPAHCHGGSPLVDGEVIHAAGTEIRVLATPGHTSDSVCFHLPQDGPRGSVLTGDTILGMGTTVLDYPDGTLGDYLASLDRLERLGPATVLPAHGPMLPALDTIVRAYRDHREDRLGQIRSALVNLGPGAEVAEVADAVYAAVDPSVRPAAELSVAAQLHYLRLGSSTLQEPPG